MKLSLAPLATFLTIALAPFSAQSATLVNGDFSASNLGWTQVTFGGAAVANLSNISGGVGILNGTGNGGVGLGQTVSGFVLNGTYDLAWEVANFAPAFGDPASKNFGVEVDGVLTSFNDADLGLTGGADFQMASLSFTALNTTLNISFFGELVNDRSFSIDNVKLIRTDLISPVPLPASGLFLLGAVGTVAAIRRQRKSA